MERSTQNRQKRSHAPEMEKICRVCGDKALSVNFNVLSCESCKAFFRRNALKKKETQCQAGGQCDINVRSRRTCKTCRLRKCFEVGMVKEWIMTDEARLQKKELIERNRERRRLASLGVGTSTGPVSVSDASEIDDISPMECDPVQCTASSSSSYYSGHHRSAPVNFGWPASYGQAWSASISGVNPSAPLLFPQHPSPSPVRTCSILPISNSSTPAPLGPKLPIKPASPSLSPYVAGPSVPYSTGPGEELVRLPKSLLASLINCCHAEAVSICDHDRPPEQCRQTVIVSNSSSPLRCICPCKCGSSAWSAVRKETVDKCVYTGDDEEEEDGPGYHDHSGSSSDEHQLALISSESPKEDFVFNFNFGLSGSKLFHLADLLTAFSYPQSPIGRTQDQTELMPALPTIDSRMAMGECMRRTDAMIRRLVRFCSRITASSDLNRRVLAKLVKGCASPLILIHSVLAYSLESDAWYDAGPNIRPMSAKTELDSVKGGVHQDHTRFIRSFPLACKNDVSVIVIMCAISLFNPDLVGPNEKAYVRSMRNFYIGLLIQYLHNKFEPDKARRLQRNILSHVDTCLRMAERVTPTVVLELDETNMEPLLIELLGYNM